LTWGSIEGIGVWTSPVERRRSPRLSGGGSKKREKILKKNGPVRK